MAQLPRSYQLGKIKTPSSQMINRVQSSQDYLSNNLIFRQASGLFPYDGLNFLFSNGEKGALYDPSDLNTVWQDTTATVRGQINQPVARLNDKSGNNFHVTQAVAGSRPVLRGTPQGANLVTNSRLFNTVGYTLGAGWASDASPGLVATLASASTTYDLLLPTIGKTYAVAYTVYRTAGSMSIQFGGATAIGVPTRSLTGRFVEYIQAATADKLTLTGVGFSGRVESIEIYSAEEADVNIPYLLDGISKFLTGNFSGVAAYPISEFVSSKNHMEAGNPFVIGVQATNTNYKAIGGRGSATDREVSLLSAPVPITQACGREEVMVAAFKAANLSVDDNGIVGAPTVNTNAFTAPVTVSVGTTGSLPYNGHFYGGGVLARDLLAAEKTTINAFYGGVNAIVCWGDSLTAGLGATVAGWVPRLGQSLGRVVVNNGVGGETSTQIITRFSADLTATKSWINTLWTGQNDNYLLNNWSDTLAAVNTFINTNIANNNGKWLVFGTTMPSGGAVITQAGLDRLDAILTANCGARFVDERAYLMSKNDGTAGDLADVAAGLVPRSLRSDNIHLNDIGYQHVADLVRSKIIELGWGWNWAIS